MAPRRKTAENLAQVLAAVASQGDTTESKADSILAIVKAAGIKSLPDFDLAIRAAYIENGWHAGRGRPKAGAAEATNVPRTVKTYVTEVRRGLKIGVRFGSVASFGELRQRLAKARARTKGKAEGPPELKGVKFSRPDTLIGQPFHDLGVLYAALPANHQAVLKKQVDRLCSHYKKHLPELVAAQDALKAAA